LSDQVFRHAVGLLFRLVLSSADLGGMKSSRRRRGGGKVESVLCFPVFHRHQAAARCGSG